MLCQAPASLGIIVETQPVAVLSKSCRSRPAQAIRARRHMRPVVDNIDAAQRVQVRCAYHKVPRVLEYSRCCGCVRGESFGTGELEGVQKAKLLPGKAEIVDSIEHESVRL